MQTALGAVGLGILAVGGAVALLWYRPHHVTNVHLEQHLSNAKTKTTPTDSRHTGDPTGRDLKLPHAGGRMPRSRASRRLWAQNGGVDVQNLSGDPTDSDGPTADHQ